MTDHTPGPWRVLNVGSRSLSFGIGSNGPGLVAQVSTIPNARLIATAPELLKALQFVSQWMDEPAPSWPTEEDADAAYVVHSKVIQAIARATGEE